MQISYWQFDEKKLCVKVINVHFLQLALPGYESHGYTVQKCNSREMHSHTRSLNGAAQQAWTVGQGDGYCLQTKCPCSAN